MKHGSTFSGIGGGDLAMESAGFEPAFQIENAKFPQRVLTERWPEVQRFDDITTVDVRQLERVDVLHGGFPCQDVSVAGRRAGLAGERSGLFFEFIRLAAALRPRWIVIENVPGLRSSWTAVDPSLLEFDADEGPGRQVVLEETSDFGTVLDTLEELGYGWAVRSFDAQYFGLAQRRERVFIVGCLGDAAGAAAVLFEPEGGSGDPPTGGSAGEDVAYALTSRAGGGRLEREDTYVTHALTGEGHDASEDGTGRGTPLVASTLSAGSLTSGVSAPGRRREDDTNLVVIQDARGLRDKAQNGIDISEGGPMYTLDGTSEHAVAFAENQRGEVVTSEVTHQLSGGGGKPGQGYAAAMTPMGVRKLTPLECERLQGFPDGWTCLCGAQGVTAECTCPDGPRYKALGNAIAVPVMVWIARRISEANDAT